jgi:hypothetical protein
MTTLVEMRKQIKGHGGNGRRDRGKSEWLDDQPIFKPVVSEHIYTAVDKRNAFFIMVE